MKTSVLSEIGVMSALGGAFGTILAILFGAYWWIGLVVGALLVSVLYRPKESIEILHQVVVAASKAVGETGTMAAETPQMERARQTAGVLGLCVLNLAYYGGLVVMWCLVSALSANVLIIVLSSSADPATTWWQVGTCGGWSAIAAVLMWLYFVLCPCSIYSKRERQGPGKDMPFWLFPIAHTIGMLMPQRIRDWYEIESEESAKSPLFPHGTYRHSDGSQFKPWAIVQFLFGDLAKILLLPAVAFVLGSLAFVLLIADCLLSVLLALGTTNRLAVAAGSLIGASAGYGSYEFGITSAALIAMMLGAIVGCGAGILLHLANIELSRKFRTVTDRLAPLG